MIAIDTSALLAILGVEPRAEDCLAALRDGGHLQISAGTLAEALIVAGGRGIAEQLARLIDGLKVEIVPVTATSARQAADAYRRWGKGNHPAALNYGDCFAYALAEERDCPLLYIGKDFAQTDIRSAI